MCGSREPCIGDRNKLTWQNITYFELIMLGMFVHRTKQSIARNTNPIQIFLKYGVLQHRYWLKSENYADHSDMERTLW